MSIQMSVSLETNMNFIHYPVELKETKHSGRHKGNTEKCLLNLST